MHTQFARRVVIMGVLVIGAYGTLVHAVTLGDTRTGQDIVTAIIRGEPLETVTATNTSIDTATKADTTDKHTTQEPKSPSHPPKEEPSSVPIPPLQPSSPPHPIPPEPAQTVTSSLVRTASTPSTHSTSTASTTTTPIVKPHQSAPRMLEPVVSSAKPAARPSSPSTPTESSTAHTKRQHLETLSTSIQEVRTETRLIERTVHMAVSRNVDAALAQVDVATTRRFDPQERERILTKLTSQVAQKQAQLSEDVHATLAESSYATSTFPTLTPVLKSSLDDIALLIKQESGVDIDLSPQARAISSAVAEATPTFLKARDELLKREGLDLYTDTDADGISDYDETHLYFTDPLNAFTAGSTLTDGERVLLGFDPLSTSTQRIPVESPRTVSETTVHIFEVDRIARTGSVNSSTSTPMESSAQGTYFAGRGLPNSFVTLYIFSTPVVVTLKTDDEGRWEYTLTTELENGTHELYVATVDNAGKILAQSPVVPFVQTAEAVEFTPLLIASASPDPDPVDVLNNNFIAVAVFVALAFTIGALAILGVMHRRNSAAPTTVA